MIYLCLHHNVSANGIILANTRILLLFMYANTEYVKVHTYLKNRIRIVER